jgi:hypothetical protein
MFGGIDIGDGVEVARDMRVVGPSRACNGSRASLRSRTNAVSLTKAKTPGRWGHDLFVETRCVLHSGNMESNEQRQGAYLHSCC